MNLFLATEPEGKPTEEGKWVYAGPQVAREGEDEILVTAISGSLVTLNRRDTSAMIHWVPDVNWDVSFRRSTFPACRCRPRGSPVNWSSGLRLPPRPRKKKRRPVRRLSQVPSKIAAATEG